MIKAQQLYDIAKCRYEEAGILLVNKKADGAVYLCGYSLELILKYKIVKVLNWDGYPENSNEFKGYQSFKVHNLDVLLKLSGLEKKFKQITQYMPVGKSQENGILKLDTKRLERCQNLKREV